jgi:hypothetical protein
MKSRPAVASAATIPFRFPRPAFPLALLAAAACGQAVAAADDPVPYYLGVSQTETADSNVLRLEDNGSRTPRDLISTTGLNAGLDQPIGRGRLVVDLNVNTNNFKNQKQLNYTGGEGKLRLDWETLYRISGDISLHQENTLYRSNPSTSVVVNERDVLRNSGADLRARIGLVTRWSLEGGASYGESRHSSRSQSFQDLTQTSGNVGIRFRPSDLWSVRLGVRDTRAEYPNIGRQNGTNQSDDVHRSDIDLSGDWSPSGNSKLDARLSSTRERHSLTGTRDINTWTGLLGYNWLLTGKTHLRLQLARDSNVGNSDVDSRLSPPSPDTATRSTSDTQARNRLSLQANWDATSKISADFGYTHVRSKLDNNLSNALTGATRKITEHDRSNIVGLGLTYRPTRNVLLGCKLSHEERSADAKAELTFPYKVDTGSCQVQFRI